MKIIDLYGLEPVRVDKDIGELRGFYYDHVEELEQKCFDANLYRMDNQKIEIYYHGEGRFDARRTWTLASVWYEGNPLMIIQNAGRGGDDYAKRFITDEGLYREMIEYMVSISGDEHDDREEDCDSGCKLEDVYDEEYESDELVEFYGHKLEEFI